MGLYLRVICNRCVCIPFSCFFFFFLFFLFFFQQPRLSIEGYPFGKRPIKPVAATLYAFTWPHTHRCARMQSYGWRQRKEWTTIALEREREGIGAVPAEFTMINRHRLLIVLDLDGWARRGQQPLYFGHHKESRSRE